MRREAGVTNDIVVEGFQDTYDNLTLKTVFLLKWLSASCPRAKERLK